MAPEPGPFGTQLAPHGKPQWKYEETATSIFGCENPNQTAEILVKIISDVIIWLVVWTPLKKMKVNGKDYPIYYGK